MSVIFESYFRKQDETYMVCEIFIVFIYFINLLILQSNAINKVMRYIFCHVIFYKAKC